MGNQALISSERTSELLYPAIMVLNSGERLAMAEGIEGNRALNISEHTCGLAWERERERGLGTRKFLSPKISRGGPTAPYQPTYQPPVTISGLGWYHRLPTTGGWATVVRGGWSPSIDFWT